MGGDERAADVGSGDGPVGDVASPTPAAVALLQFLALRPGMRVLVRGQIDPAWESDLRARCDRLDRTADHIVTYDLILVLPGDDVADVAELLAGSGQVLAVGTNPAGIARWASGTADVAARPEHERLADDLERAGLAVGGWAGVFPDHRRARVVMTPEVGLVDAQLCHRLPSFPSRIAGMEGPLVDEYRLFRELVRHGGADRACGLGGSVLVWAGRGDVTEPVWPRGQVAAYATADRRDMLTTRVALRRTPAGAEFERTAVSAPTGATFRRLSLIEQYVPGTPLLELLDSARDEDVPGLLARWAELVEQWRDDDGAPLDLVPHNVLIGSDGVARAVDNDLRAAGWKAEDVLARGALVTAVELTARGRTTLLPAATVGDLARQLGASVGLDGEWLPAAVIRELAVLAEVGGADPRSADLADLLALPREAAHRGLAGLVSPMRMPDGIDDHVTELTAEVGRLRRHSDGLAAGLASAQASVADLQRHLGEVEADRQAVRKESERITADRAAVRSELERVQEDRAAIGAQVQDLRAATLDHQAVIERLQDRVLVDRRRLADAEVDADRARAERDRAWGTLDMMRWQRDNARAAAGLESGTEPTAG